MSAQAVIQATSKPLFPIGRLVATLGALKAMEQLGVVPMALVSRHVSGDFGDLCEEDRQENETAIKHGLRILSAYQIQEVKFWIITEADRSATTILLPEEY